MCNRIQKFDQSKVRDIPQEQLSKSDLEENNEQESSIIGENVKENYLTHDKVECIPSEFEETKEHRNKQEIQDDKQDQKSEKAQEKETSNDEGVDLESQSTPTNRDYNQTQTNLDEEDSIGHIVQTPRVELREIECSSRHVGQDRESLEECKEAPDYEFGIVNEGNTCFLNAALQCIFSSNEFIHYYQQEKYLPKNQIGYLVDSKYRMKLEGFHFSDAMRKICDVIIKEQTETIEVIELRNMMKDIFPLGEQNDAMQFISHIFDNLQSEETPKISRFNPNGYDNYVDAWNEYTDMFPSIIDKLFSGMLQKNITCNGCGNVKKSFEKYNQILLSLDTDTLLDAYHEFILEESVFESGMFKCKA